MFNKELVYNGKVVFDRSWTFIRTFIPKEQLEKNSKHFTCVLFWIIYCVQEQVTNDFVHATYNTGSITKPGHSILRTFVDSKCGNFVRFCVRM